MAFSSHKHSLEFVLHILSILARLVFSINQCCVAVYIAATNAIVTITLPLFQIESLPMAQIQNDDWINVLFCFLFYFMFTVCVYAWTAMLQITITAYTIDECIEMSQSCMCIVCAYLFCFFLPFVWLHGSMVKEIVAYTHTRNTFKLKWYVNIPVRENAMSNSAKCEMTNSNRITFFIIANIYALYMYTMCTKLCSSRGQRTNEFVIINSHSNDQILLSVCSCSCVSIKCQILCGWNVAFAKRISKANQTKPINVRVSC